MRPHPSRASASFPPHRPAFALAHARSHKPANPSTGSGRALATFAPARRALWPSAAAKLTKVTAARALPPPRGGGAPRETPPHRQLCQLALRRNPIRRRRCAVLGGCYSTRKSVTTSRAGPVANTPWPYPSPPPSTKPPWSASASASRKA